jgi:hypothetical protein
MTVQAEYDSRVGAWFDCHYANEADLELNDDGASTALKRMALGGVVLAVVFALSLAVWACGPVAFKSLPHAPKGATSTFLLPHGPG